MKAIQYTATFQDIAEANNLLEHLSEQETFLGGRILQRWNTDCFWLQVFFECGDDHDYGIIGEDTKVVRLLEMQYKTVGINGCYTQANPQCSLDSKPQSENQETLQTSIFAYYVNLDLSHVTYLAVNNYLPTNANIVSFCSVDAAKAGIYQEDEDIWVIAPACDSGIPFSDYAHTITS